jgi:hypothetical protein
LNCNTVWPPQWPPHFDEINIAIADVIAVEVMKPVIHLAGGQPPGSR